MPEIQEIYTHTSQLVYLDIYGGSADALPTATLQDGVTHLTVTQDAPLPDENIQDRYHVVLNMAQTQNEGDLAITWNFTMSGAPVSKTDRLEVVSPILSEGTIYKIHPNATQDEVLNVEKAVRHIINAYCGQTFGYFEGVKTVYGRGSKLLYLPTHLLELTSVNGVTDPTTLVLSKNGWELHFYPWGLPHGYGVTGVYMTKGVVHDARLWFEGCWEDGISYDISGKWGYLGTPAPVAEAAKLLVNDYACSDNQYRDRFLLSMTAADWRLEFFEGAFTNTGNVRANQLLDEYVIKNNPWVAI